MEQLKNIDPWKYPLLALVLVTFVLAVLSFSATMTTRSTSDFKVKMDNKIKAIEHHETLAKQDKKQARVKTKVPMHLGSKRALMQLSGKVNIETDATDGNVLLHFKTGDQVLTHPMDLDMANDAEVQKTFFFNYVTAKPGDLSVTYETGVPVKNITIENMKLEGTYIKA